MAWKSKPMTSDCVEFYIKVGNFTLIKETPKAIKVRLENHPKKLAIWMAKKITRGYNGTSAWFWGEALRQNIYREEQRLKANEEKMEAAFNNGFNASNISSRFLYLYLPKLFVLPFSTFRLLCI